jgi:hypothetical protein
MAKEVRRRIAMGVVSGVSAASFGLTFAGASHEADARDPHYKTSPDVRRIIQPQLNRANTLLSSEITGYQADQPIIEALDDEVRAISLTEGQWTRVKKASQEIAAGQAAENGDNALGIASVVSLLFAAGTGLAAGGVRKG